MNRLACLAALLVSAGTALQAQTASKPNIIFVLADDLGLDGVSCYGSDKHKTPNIDKLAASGTRFETCYAAPLCGPSRCLLNTGRYAFRTGGLTNGSWRANGPGAKSADEIPMAKAMKTAGYATCQSGKWRQVGETPGDWGYDEYFTDPTAGGYFWKTEYTKNGQPFTAPAGSYQPDLAHKFAIDFINRRKDTPFFLYYAMHLVHKPTQHTPDSPAGSKDGEARYDDTIAYMDKEVGELMAELDKLGLREKTLLIFSGDNGTATGYPSTVNGRMINGAKGSMLEGGSRVPFVASWPGVTPAGKVQKDIISFADLYATFVELGGGNMPADFKSDSHSFAPQLRGETGNPRPWAYVQLGPRWFVREQGYKLNEQNELFDMSDAPYVEKLVPTEADTDAGKAARARLSAALTELNPAGGKADRGDGKRAKGKKGRKGKDKKEMRKKKKQAAATV